jgi:hypothetical protein
VEHMNRLGAQLTDAFENGDLFATRPGTTTPE